MTDVAQIGVVGAGFMGSGIAESAARAGVAVMIYEPQTAPLEHSRSSIEASVARAVERGKLTADDAGALVARIDWSTDLCESLHHEFKQHAYAPPPLMKRMVVSGHLGRKTGRGFYEYD